MKRLVCPAALLIAIAACGKGTPTSPTASQTSTTPIATTPTTAATLASCAAWSATQRAAGVPSGRGDVQSQREALYTAGGHGGLAKNADAVSSMFTYFESLR